MLRYVRIGYLAVIHWLCLGVGRHRSHLDGVQLEEAPGVPLKARDTFPLSSSAADYSS
jgi:hypothetical protein